ncbi:MAG: hypothetical protein HOW73_49195 [Polyangiaceae bacterium]|nr:hypothetical protein [Polyangiaceae bacterium]
MKLRLRFHTLLTSAALTFALVASTEIVRADEPVSEVEVKEAVVVAEQARADAQHAYDEGDLEKAQTLLEHADALAHVADDYFRLAVICEARGYYQEASTYFKAYLQETKSKGDRARTSIIAIARMEEEGGTIVVRADPGLEDLVLDGRPQRLAAPAKLLVAPGEHVVTAMGHVDTKAVVDVQAGETVEVLLAREPTTPAAGGCASCTVTNDITPTEPVGVTLIGLVVLAVRRGRRR